MKENFHQSILHSKIYIRAQKNYKKPRQLKPKYLNQNPTKIPKPKSYIIIK